MILVTGVLSLDTEGDNSVNSNIRFSMNNHRYLAEHTAEQPGVFQGALNRLFGFATKAKPNLIATPLVACTSHHKTGTSLCDHILQAIESADPEGAHFVNPYQQSSTIHYDEHSWPHTAELSNPSYRRLVLVRNEHVRSLPPQPPTYPPLRCLVHMVRDPIALVVSAYMYHLRVGTTRPHCGDGLCESWLYEPTSLCSFISTNASLGLFDKLQMAQNDEEGLKCQLESSEGTIVQMAQMDALVRQHRADAITIDLEEWHDFDATLHRVFSFCGLSTLEGAVSKIFKAAMAVNDLQRHSVHINTDTEKADRLKSVLRAACEQGGGEIPSSMPYLPSPATCTFHGLLWLEPLLPSNPSPPPPLGDY